jgi:hypothetical protein
MLHASFSQLKTALGNRKYAVLVINLPLVWFGSVVSSFMSLRACGSRGGRSEMSELPAPYLKRRHLSLLSVSAKYLRTVHSASWKRILND